MIRRSQRRLRSLCDVYVNDAFAPRIVPKRRPRRSALCEVACAGPLMSAELDALGKALAHPARPLIAIRRRSKSVDQAHDPATLAEKVQSLIVGAHRQHLPARGGKPIGRSLAEPDLAGEAKQIAAMTEVPLPPMWCRHSLDQREAPSSEWKR